MFEISELPERPYSDPWALSYEDRFSLLMRRDYKVAYFYEQADNSTFRYRVYNPTQVLNELSENIGASYFFLADFDRMDRVIREADLLVICRCKYSHKINSLITRFRSLGKKVLYDIDDLVFDIRYAHLIGETIGVDLREETGWNTWFAYVSRHGAAVQLCDGCITTNRVLADRLRDYSALPVSIMKNFMNKEQVQISNDVYEKRKAAKRTDDSRITIGYFSGTPTHAKDFSVAREGLLNVMRANNRVDLLLAGFMSIDWVDDSLRHRVRQHPFTDYVNLQRLVGSVNYNIVPLVSNVFTNCKSELKYFEAAIVGTPSVVSPTVPYTDCIHDGVNGYISKAHQWESILSNVTADENGYHDISLNCRRLALLDYSWTACLDHVVNALGLPQCE